MNRSTSTFLFIYVQIKEMDLEARSLPPNAKSSLLVKLREYKSDLNKRITSGNLNKAAARDELLEAGMADKMTVCNVWTLCTCSMHQS